MAKRVSDGLWAKGADMHVLSVGKGSSVAVFGVVEVKSYACPWSRVHDQLQRHVERARLGLAFEGGGGTAAEPGSKMVRIGVVPSRWRLPRSFHLEPYDGGRTVRMDPAAPLDSDEVEKTGQNEWRVRLRWSAEALAAAAYELTFWYMAQVGATTYGKDLPKEWAHMTPEEAGRNATKMMLYYALLRCRTLHENQRAVSLYNVYGFGCALGTAFMNAKGHRDMLWPEDLDEILASGKTKNGSRLRHFRWKQRKTEAGEHL